MPQCVATAQGGRAHVRFWFVLASAEGVLTLTTSVVQQVSCAPQAWKAVTLMDGELLEGTAATDW